MEIEKKDRLILINQYTILQFLDPDSRNSYEEKVEILRDGYKIFYSDLDISLDDDMPEEKSEFVLSTLSVYRMIEYYKNKHQDDAEICDHPLATFRGFDGNNESEYLGFTRFLINQQEKFEEQKKYERETDGFNSHIPMVSAYARMVNKWRALGCGYEIPKDVVLEILNA